MGRGIGSPPVADTVGGQTSMGVALDLNEVEDTLNTDASSVAPFFGSSPFDGDSNDPWYGAGADMFYDDASNRSEVPMHDHGRGRCRPRRAAGGGLLRGVGAAATGGMPPLSTGHIRGKRPASSEGGRAARGHGKGKAAYKPPRPTASESDIHVDSWATGDEEDDVVGAVNASTGHSHWKQLKKGPPEHEELLQKMLASVVVDGSGACVPREDVGQDVSAGADFMDARTNDSVGTGADAPHVNASPVASGSRRSSSAMSIFDSDDEQDMALTIASTRVGTLRRFQAAISAFGKFYLVDSAIQTDKNI